MNWAWHSCPRLFLIAKNVAPRQTLLQQHNYSVNNLITKSFQYFNNRPVTITRGTSQLMYLCIQPLHLIVSVYFTTQYKRSDDSREQMKPKWDGHFIPVGMEWSFHSSRNEIFQYNNYYIPSKMKRAISFWPKWTMHSVDANKKYAPRALWS